MSEPIRDYRLVQRALAEACTKHPDQRVMQVIVNAIGPDPFYIEDQDAAARLTAYAIDGLGWVKLRQAAQADELPPLLSVVFAALRERGWTMREDGGLIDPEGNAYASVVDALYAQTFREIGVAGADPGLRLLWITVPLDAIMPPAEREWA